MKRTYNKNVVKSNEDRTYNEKPIIKAVEIKKEKPKFYDKEEKKEAK